MDTLYWFELDRGSYKVKASATYPTPAVKFNKEHCYIASNHKYPMFDGKSGWLRKVHTSAKQFEAIKLYEQQCMQAWSDDNAKYKPYEDDEPGTVYGYNVGTQFDNSRNPGTPVG